MQQMLRFSLMVPKRLRILHLRGYVEQYLNVQFPNINVRVTHLNDSQNVVIPDEDPVGDGGQFQVGQIFVENTQFLVHCVEMTIIVENRTSTREELPRII